jgi:glutathione S-transferase
MLQKERLTLIGAPPSPYTRKMIALLRYRHIPYQIIWGNPGELLDGEGPLAELNIEPPKPVLLPTFLMRDDSGELKTVTDSTPIIRRLEKEYDGRSVIPNDPALCFLNYLLEDFGDEWVTKYMFHYRWHFEEDADNASSILPLNHKVNLSEDAWKLFKEGIGKRQIERLWVVGSNNITASIIENSYKRFLEIMQTHLENLPFLFGYRPSSADFAIYGQLTQLIGLDPTSRAIAHEKSLRTVSWINGLEDLSGIEPENNPWIGLEELPESMKSLLQEIGRGYVPALLENSKALEKGNETWETEIDGSTWSQKTFNYQGKCLQWINQEFYTLTEIDQKRLLNLFAGTGCEKLLMKEHKK